MSKADRIRELLKTGEYTVRQITDIVGCLPEYVRVIRQRTSKFGNPIETRSALSWKQANWDFVRSYSRNAQRRYRARKAEARAS